VVLDLSQHCHRILELNADQRYAIVEPGIVCDSLRDAAELHGLPATPSRCTLGGLIGNNSCSAHSVMAAETLQNVEALEVLTYGGERFWAGPAIARMLKQPWRPRPA
jgi:FAD/FMN-containing dehydrogenase